MIMVRLCHNFEERIINCRINKDGTDGIIVCKRKGFRNADILKMSDTSYFKSLRFMQQSSEKIYIKISKEQNRILLNN